MPTDLASWLSSVYIGDFDISITIVDAVREILEEEDKPKQHLGFADYLENK